MTQGSSILASWRVKDDVLDAIVSAILRKAEKPPPGFYPIDYWEKRWKCKRSCAKRYLSEGVKAGILERIELRKFTGKFIRRCPFFGPKRNRSKVVKMKPIKWKR